MLDGKARMRDGGAGNGGLGRQDATYSTICLQKLAVLLVNVMLTQLTTTLNGTEIPLTHGDCEFLPLMFGGRATYLRLVDAMRGHYENTRGRLQHGTVYV